MLRSTFAGLVLFATSAAAQTALPLDTATDVGGVSAVCTGIGSDHAENPAWKAYPLKIVVSGKMGQFLADADVAIAKGSKTITTLQCEAPWILVKLEPGRYKVTATRGGKVMSAAVTVPASGQRETNLRFPNAGGEVSAEHTDSLKATAPR